MISAVTYWIDPASNLITQVTLDTTGREIQAIYDVTIEVRDQPLDRELFEFDATPFRGSVNSKSLLRVFDSDESPNPGA